MCCLYRHNNERRVARKRVNPCLGRKLHNSRMKYDRFMGSDFYIKARRKSLAKQGDHTGNSLSLLLKYLDLENWEVLTHSLSCSYNRAYMVPLSSVHRHNCGAPARDVQNKKSQQIVLYIEK